MWFGYHDCVDELVLSDLKYDTEVAAIPEAHILSTLSTMAPLRIMPSVWPVFSLSSVALVTCTPGMLYFQYRVSLINAF